MARLDLSVIVKTLGQANLKGLSNDLNKIDKKADTTGQKLSNALNPKNLLLGGGVALAGAQIVGFLNDSAAAASDLSESQSKVNAVFGAGAVEINKWAETSAEGFLMSKQQALEAAGTYGNLFRAFGIAQPAATEMSTTLVELAGDLASFNNTSVDDALLALRSGLSGETEPLKRYGVSLNEARLKQAALTAGIWDGTGALSTAQKAQAAYTLILQDTALAQGDVARTGDQLAGSQKRTAAEIANFQAEIGQVWASIQLGAIRVKDFLGQEWSPWEDVARRWNTDFADVTGALDGFLFGVKDKVSSMPSDMQIAALAAVRAVETEYIKGQPIVAKEAGKIAGLLPSEIAARDAEIRAAGRENVIQFSLGVLDAQNDPKLAFEVLTRLQDEEMTRAEEISYLHGLANTEELASGLDDGRPGVSTASDTLVSVIDERLEELTGKGYSWGLGVGNELARGMDASLDRVYRASSDMASATGSAIRIESEPPDHSSALYGITKWGGNLVRTYADDIQRNLGLLTGASGGMAGALALSAGGAPAGGGGATVSGGPQFHTHLTVVGDVRAKDEQEVEDALIRAQRFQEIGVRQWG